MKASGEKGGNFECAQLFDIGAIAKKRREEH